MKFFERIDTGTDYEIVVQLVVPLWFQLWIESLPKIQDRKAEE